MKTSTLLLIAAAGVVGYELAKRRAKAAARTSSSLASIAVGEPTPVNTPAVVVIDNTTPYDYYWGPAWWGPWSGGGGHRHGGGHGGHGGHHGGHH